LAPECQSLAEKLTVRLIREARSCTFQGAWIAMRLTSEVTESLDPWFLSCEDKTVALPYGFAIHPFRITRFWITDFIQGPGSPSTLILKAAHRRFPGAECHVTQKGMMQIGRRDLSFAMSQVPTPFSETISDCQGSGFSTARTEVLCGSVAGSSPARRLRPRSRTPASHTAPASAPTSQRRALKTPETPNTPGDPETPRDPHRPPNP